MCLSVFLLEFILYGILHFLYFGDCFPMLGKFSTIISSNIFSGPFPFSSSRTSIMQMLVCLTLSQRSLRLFSLFFSPHIFFLFSLYCFVTVISTTLNFNSLLPSYASVILLSIPSSYCSFQLSCCSSLFFKSSLFVKYFWYLLDLCLHSFFLRFLILYCHYSEFFFR